MTEAIVAGLFGLAVVLLGQWFLHRRWAAEQDEKRSHEADNILARMAEQNSAVVANALKVAEVHQEDAEKARQLALETARNHTECRAEVAHLAGKVEELRARMTETERTAGQNALATERHRDLKHRALNALTVAEGYVALVQKLVPNCTCHAFDPLEQLTATVKPRVEELLSENLSLAQSEEP